jgi:hypothetical protein
MVLCQRWRARGCGRSERRRFQGHGFGTTVCQSRAAAGPGVPRCFKGGICPLAGRGCSFTIPVNCRSGGSVAAERSRSFSTTFKAGTLGRARALGYSDVGTLLLLFSHGRVRHGALSWRIAAKRLHPVPCWCNKPRPSRRRSQPRACQPDSPAATHRRHAGFRPLSCRAHVVSIVQMPVCRPQKLARIGLFCISMLYGLKCKKRSFYGAFSQL